MVDHQTYTRLRDEIRGVLVDGVAPSRDTSAVIGLLYAAHEIRTVIDKPDLKDARKTAKDIAEENWASESVEAAFAEVQATLIVAVSSATGFIA